MLTLPEACEAFADLIEAVPALWTHDAYARTSSDLETEPGDPKAVCWCAVGGVMAATRRKYAKDVHKYLTTFGVKLFGEPALTVNDVLGRKAAIKMLRAAAKGKP